MIMMALRLQNQCFFRAQYKPTEAITMMADIQWSKFEQDVVENAIRQYDFYNRVWTNIYARATRDELNNFNTDSGVATADVTLNSDFTDADYTRNYDFLAPKLGINWNINNDISVFVNYSKANKEPKVGDWYSRSNGPDLTNSIKEESITDLELGINYITSKQGSKYQFISYGI